ncbi:MAG: glycosyltransferase [Planctomycetales bacterium]
MMEIESPPGPAGGSSTAPRLVGRDMLCFGHDWTGDPLSKTHLMRAMSRNNRILWINSIGYRTPSLNKADMGRVFRKLAVIAKSRLREVEPNLFVLNPLAIPVFGSPLVRRLNRQLLKWQIKSAMRKLKFRRTIDWVFNPTAAVVAGELGEDSVIYYCVDEFSAFTGVQVQHLQELEQILMRRADGVIVSAEELRKSKSQFNPKTVMVAHGVDFDHFRMALDDATVIPEEVRDLPRPVLGFFGLIADFVDLELIGQIAKRFPQGTVVMLGNPTTDTSCLEGVPNVRLLGRKPYADLPAYCKAFDVALMPFKINQLMINANPLKMREYIAAGLPVVATPLPEVAKLGLCRLATSVDDYVREINAALEDPGPSRARSETMRSEGWMSRVDLIAQHLDQFGVLNRNS